MSKEEIKQKKLIRLVAQLYQCISGRNNAGRSWEKYATLFIPSASIHVVVSNKGRKIIEAKSIPEYIDYFIHTIGDRPFYEREVGHHIEFVDSYSVYWSDYEARFSLKGKPVYVGTNCFQMFYDGKRWQVVSMLWERKLKAEHLK